ASSIAVCIAAASGALRRIATAAEVSMIIRQTVRVVQIVLADPQMWCRRDFVLQAGDPLSFRLAPLAHPCQVVLPRLPDRGGRARPAGSAQLPGEGRDARSLDGDRCQSRSLPWVVDSGRRSAPAADRPGGDPVVRERGGGVQCGRRPVTVWRCPMGLTPLLQLLGAGDYTIAREVIQRG